jgi:phage terminase large subunit
MSNPKQNNQEIVMPRAVAFLAKPTPYKILYGGRLGIKSWSIARQLLIDAVNRPVKTLCCREMMNSIADSVHTLLADQIKLMGMAAHFEVQKASIIGINGSQFAFAGLHHNVTGIKSYEGFDRAWVEEAQTVSKASWEILIPTIRKEHSEIWVSFNPELETDDTYQRFVLHPPPGAVVVKTSYRDNPWLSQKSLDDMAHTKAKSQEDFDHIYEGCCISTVEGAIYGAEMRAAEKDGRITKVAYDATKPVHTFWDLGWADATAIWFVQAFPWEYRVIDYMEGSGQPLSFYLQALQRKGYVFGKHYLPHDARARTLATGKSVQELMVAAGFSVSIVPNIGVADGINAVRTIMPQCWFDAEKCADGLQALRRYKWSIPGSSGIIKREPLHDENSNGSDAFRMMAVGVKAPQASEKPKEQYMPTYAGAWS